jgi:hypothetical protein
MTPGQRVKHKQLGMGGYFEHSGLVQEGPYPGKGAKRLRADAVQEIVASNHEETDCSDCPKRQKNKPRQDDHRRPDSPDDLGDEQLASKVEIPTEAYHRKFDQDQP